MNSFFRVTLCLLVILGVVGQLGATFAAGNTTNYGFWRDAAKQGTVEAWRLMGSKPAEVIVLTNAGYAVVQGSSTEGCIDGLSQATGATVGKANLLEVHSSREHPLWFLVFDKNTGNSVYCEVNSQAVPANLGNGKPVGLIANDRLFSKISTANIGAKTILANPAAWNDQVKAKVFNGREFALLTLANVAAAGAPYDFVKAALYHDHLCPGVNSGYLIANYLDKQLPLRSADEKYYIISTPVWCKEDALQTLLNTTPGKSGMAILPLDNNGKEKLIPEAKNLAGIYIRWNSKTQTGDGLVLSFDFSQANAISGIDNSKGFPWESKLKMDLFLLDYYDKPEVFVDIIKNFTLVPGEKPESYAALGTNVLEKLGLVK